MSSRPNTTSLGDLFQRTAPPPRGVETVSAPEQPAPRCPGGSEKDADNAADSRDSSSKQPFWPKNAPRGRCLVSGLTHKFAYAYRKEHGEWPVDYVPPPENERGKRGRKGIRYLFTDESGNTHSINLEQSFIFFLEANEAQHPQFKMTDGEILAYLREMFPDYADKLDRARLRDARSTYNAGGFYDRPKIPVGERSSRYDRTPEGVYITDTRGHQLEMIWPQHRLVDETLIKLARKDRRRSEVRLKIRKLLNPKPFDLVEALKGALVTNAFQRRWPRRFVAVQFPKPLFTVRKK